MERQPTTYPCLDALRGRGDAAYTGEPFSFLLVEVRDDRLQITGAGPLADDGDRYIRTGGEFRYLLEGAEAERLLTALSHCADRPERVIAREFEFSRPRCPLRDYLDALHITYQYHATKGEPL